MPGWNAFGWPYPGEGPVGFGSSFGPPSPPPDLTGSGPGNGGEAFGIRLAPNGTSVTATLSAGITATGSLLQLSGDSGLPSTVPFCLTIDGEVLYVAKISAGVYRVRGRGVSNTTPASHALGASATWTDSYDMAVGATKNIAAAFTANINGTGSTTYNGWLIEFDSSQGYLGASRYPMHVAQVLGVFAAGAGGGGSNRCDSAEPNAVSTTSAVSDNCPVALSIPLRLIANVAPGDVALTRYTNPEASVLDLGDRACSLQSWFGLHRVNASDADVTATDPTAHIIDGTAIAQFHNPSPAYTSTILPGADRTFTHGGTPSPPDFNEHGWPIGILAVRQGGRRVPGWVSYDWHDFGYVYSGFHTDALFAQLVVNRNGNIAGTAPIINLPGPQDISGPDAVWDDGSYDFGAAVYVAMFNTPFPVIGPSIGGPGVISSNPATSFVPIVDFEGGPGSPSITYPAYIEGGSGGDITPPTAGRQRSNAQLV